MEQEQRTTEPPRKKLAEMTPEERRAYNAQSKRKSRDKEKQERLAAMVPAYADFRLPDTQREQLTENARQMIDQIATELSQLTFEDRRVIEMASDVLLSHEKAWAKEVHSPYGLLYGRYFVDGAASEIIEHIHRFPNLLESPTLTALYQKFLKTVRKLSRNSWFDPNFAKQIESEFDGTYELPGAPDIPKVPTPAEPQPGVLNFAAKQIESVSELSRARLLDRLKENLSPEQQHYLDGN
jgi:hypothetical protein